MPQLPTNPVDIVLEIPDVTIDATTLKRKAKLFALIYNMHTKQVSISWTVSHYAKNDDGSYGNSLSKIVPDYSKEQIATNDVAVNPITGFPLDPESIQPTILTNSETGEQTVIQSTVSWIGQYDFFNKMGESEPVLVHDVIKQFGMGLQNWEK
jgi:hypothetical protein